MTSAERPAAIAVDCGTHAVRCLVFDAVSGEHTVCATADLPLTFPNPGWVEIDPDLIVRATVSVLRTAIEWTRANGLRPVTVGLTNMRETAFAWQRSTGRPLYPGILWMSEQSGPKVEAWRAAGFDDLIRQRTGLTNHTFFFASKIGWLLDQHPSIRRLADVRDLAVGTVDSWLLYALTGGRSHATDVSNASRYQLLGLNTLAWDPDLCDALAIPMHCLPEVRPSEAAFGITDPAVCGAALPITGIVADQQASLYGHGCEDEGDRKMTFGTSGVACVNTGLEVPLADGLVTSVAWQDRDGRVAYEMEGSAFHSGFTVKWLSERFKTPVSWAAPMDHSPLSAADRVYVLPSFTTMGAPRWPPGRGAAITGLGMDTDVRDIARAGMEAMAFQARDLFDAMHLPRTRGAHEVAVDGGGAANDYLCQLLADMLGTEVVRPVIGEVTSVGAAKAALRGAGFEVPRYFAQRRGEAARFQPKQDRSYACEGYEHWAGLVRTLLA